MKTTTKKLYNHIAFVFNIVPRKDFFSVVYGCLCLCDRESVPLYKKCRCLSNDAHKIEAVSLSEAKKTRRACKICY